MGEETGAGTEVEAVVEEQAEAAEAGIHTTQQQAPRSQSKASRALWAMERSIARRGEVAVALEAGRAGAKAGEGEGGSQDPQDR